MEWSFDTAESKNNGYIGQGNHQIEAGDVDGDGNDEIFYGALTWINDGSVLWCTYQEHGDAMHLGDFDPTKEGLEWLKAYEDYSADSEVFDLKGPQLSPYITSNTIFKNSAAALLKALLMIVINGVFHFKTLRQANSIKFTTVSKIQVVL